MYSQHPKLAKEMESKTPKGKKLPKNVSKKHQLAAIKSKIKK